MSQTEKCTRWVVWAGRCSTRCFSVTRPSCRASTHSEFNKCTVFLDPEPLYRLSDLRCAAGNAVLSHGGHKFLWHAQQKGVFSRSEGERPEPITRRHGTTGTLRAPASTAGVRPLSMSMGLYLPKGTTRMIFASIDRGARSIAPWSLAALGISPGAHKQLQAAMATLCRLFRASLAQRVHQLVGAAGPGLLDERQLERSAFSFDGRSSTEQSRFGRHAEDQPEA